MAFIRIIIGLKRRPSTIATKRRRRGGEHDDIEGVAIGGGHDLTFAFVRGESHLVVVNPRREPARLEAPEAHGAELVWGVGAETGSDGLRLDGFGYGVFRLA